MADMTPHVPDIPPDARTAAPHAPPPNLANPATTPTPSSIPPNEQAPPQPAVDSEQPAPAPPPPRGGAAPRYESPEPIEAMYAQSREDARKMQRLLLLTLTAMLFLLLYVGLKAKQGQGGFSELAE